MENSTDIVPVHWESARDFARELIAGKHTPFPTGRGEAITRAAYCYAGGSVRAAERIAAWLDQAL